MQFPRQTQMFIIYLSVDLSSDLFDREDAQISYNRLSNGPKIPQKFQFYLVKKFGFKEKS